METDSVAKGAEKDPGQQPDSRSETRSRTKSEKGQSYCLGVKQEKFRGLYKRLTARSNELNQMLASGGEIHEVKDVYKNWLIEYEHFLQVFDDVCSLMTADEKGEFVSKEYNEKDVYLRNTKTLVENWFALKQANIEQTHELKSVIKPKDSVSQVVTSRRCRSSRHSGTTLASNVSSARLAQEQRQAELEAKSATLKKKQELDLAKFQIKLQEEELTLQTELAISDAKKKVLDKYVDNNTEIDTDVCRDRTTFVPHVNDSQFLLDSKLSSKLSSVAKVESTPIVHTDVVKTNCPVLNPTVEPFTPNRKQCDTVKETGVCKTSTGHGYMYTPQGNNFPQPCIRISDPGPVPGNVSPENMLLSVVRHLNKPPPELKRFDGDPLEYRKFLRQFNSKVVGNTDSDSDKMAYLDQFTTGVPNRIVSGYSYMDASQGYKAALNELEQRYGSYDVLAAAFVKRALDWPPIKADSPKSLDDFGIFLAECGYAVQSISAVKVLEYPDNLKKLVGKLPYHYHDKWRGMIQRNRECGQEIKFSQFVEFVKSEARKANDPVYGKDAMRPEQKNIPTVKSKFPSNKSRASYVTKVTDDTVTQSTSTVGTIPVEKVTAFKGPCSFCNKASHTLEQCEKISNLPYQERIDFLKRKGYCFGCLQTGHQRKDCRIKATCRNCNAKHPTICHVDGKPPPISNTSGSHRPVKSTVGLPNTPVSEPTCTENEAVHSSAIKETECTMAILPVAVKMKNGMKVIQTYAFMDPGSTATFCSEGLLRELGGSGKPMRIRLDTMGERHSMKTLTVNGLEVCDLNLQNVIELPKVYTKDEMPVSSVHIPTQEDVEKWPHLRDISFPQISGKIGLLIGNNVPDAYTPIEVRTGIRGSPHATKSLLGWILWNVVRDGCTMGSSNAVTVNRADVVAIDELEYLKRLDRRVQDSIKLDFPENLIDDRKEHSQEDKKFLNKVNGSIHLEDRQYCISLPFKRDDVQFPNNEAQARQRLRALKSKMSSNDSYKDDYTRFMETVLKNGYAEPVPDNELVRCDGKIWYIPHHGVYHPKKPHKIRVVFDCSATYQGACLNTALLQGPDLTNNLVAVLLRFRQEPVAVMGDVESMFYRVKVPKEDSDCLRFLWWPDGNTDLEPKTYRMRVHLFGAISSPSCANMALLKTAEDNEHRFSQDVVNTIRRNFYVDDCLSSTESESKAIELVRDVTEMCELGGFRLTKWISSSRQVIESIPEERRASEVQLLDLDRDHLPNERALGVHWVTESDKLGFNIQPRDLPCTRRAILSIVSSVFDPLGLAAPFVLVGKIILQQLCSKGVGWDDQVTGENLKNWTKWLEELPRLKSVEIDRCCKPSTLGRVTAYQIHVFCDASEVGYGVTVYLRIINENGNIHVILIMGKARVAPIKKISIPRMELTAATMAVRVTRMVIKELDYSIDSTCFWTHSMSVLRYIHNDTTRFQTFVANRISVIRDGSDVQQWRYVSSKMNPADLASRGAHLDKFLNSENWFHGPQFLRLPESEWPRQICDNSLPNDDPEVKKTVTASTSIDETNSVIDSLIKRCSSWFRLKSIVGWVLVAVEKFKGLLATGLIREKKSSLGKEVKNAYLTLSKLHQAEKLLVKHVQGQYFSREIDILSSQVQKALPKDSPLKRLDPFIVDGVLRVGGRLRQSDIPYTARHPIILPRHGISHLYLDHIHRQIGHLGRNSMLNTARQKYWIIGASSTIKQLVRRCVICRRYQAQTGEQKMSDLPKDRLQPNQPPFSSVGVDYFGPIEIQKGRSILKRYGVLFTCLVSRAVHLEVAHSLDTDSCICAVRRLIARRGPIQLVRSDNGTNLVGCEKELRKEIEAWNQMEINRTLQQHDVKWIFNPPTGSHHGGVWERIIRSVRKVLYSLLHQQSRHLNDELLATLFCEVESILNSRPITEISHDYRDLDALTPNHLLLMRSGENLPPGSFDKTDNYSSRRWRQIQHLSDVFWKRWTLEYLPLLQERQKWLQPKRNLKENDLVLVVDTTPRKSWCMGRVLSTTKDRHGLVRSATVKTRFTTLIRPIDKLCLLLEADGIDAS